jgi:hypothetical protein
MANNLAGANVKLTSTSNIIASLGKIVPRQLNFISKALFGVSVGSITFSKVLLAAFKGIRAGLVKVIPLVIGLASAAAPLLLKFGTLAGAIFLVVKAVREFEERTQVFATVFGGFVDDFQNATEGPLAGFKDILVDIRDVLSGGLARAVGLLVFSLGGLLQLTNLIAQSSSSLIPDATLKRLALASQKVEELNNQLVASGFRLAEFGQTSVASTKDAGDGITSLLEKLGMLRRDLAGVETDEEGLERLRMQMRERISILRESLAAAAITGDQFLALREKVLQDWADRSQQFLRKTQTDQEKLVDRLISGMKNGTKQAIAGIGASLAKGEDAFAAFGGAVLSIIGDMLIEIGFAISGIGKAIEALRSSLLTLTGGTAIVAGLALVVLGGALKSLGGGPGLGNAGGTGTESVATETVTQPFGEDDEDLQKQTQVTVNLQGIVTNPIETATQIAELLSEVTDSNDIVVNA